MIAPVQAGLSEGAAHFAGEPEGPAPGEPVRAAFGPFEAMKRERLGFVERAALRIAQGDGADAALRELGAFLLDLLLLVERDPALELAADDLYEAAAMLVAGQGPGGRIDARCRRLIGDAARRFRGRLDAAQPGDEAQGLA
jgi:hypothetical protein